MAPSTFDSQNSSYKCCFGKIHVITATQCILYFDVLYEFVFAWFLVVNDLVGSWAWIIAFFIIAVFLLCTGLYAVKKEKPEWLIPYFVVWIFFIIWSAYDIFLISKDYPFEWILFDVSYLVLNMWFIFIVYACYQYLNAKKQGDVLPMVFSNKNIYI